MTNDSLSNVALAWHDWAYFIIVAVLVVGWVYVELRKIWKGGTKRATPEDGSPAQDKTRKPEEHALWALLAAAFLAGVAHYEIRLAAINATLDRRLSAMTAQLSRVDGRLAEVDFDRITTLRDRLDPAFNRIFGPHLDSSLANLKTAIRDKEMTLGAEDFKSLYIETLKQMKGHTLLALSYPTKEYFWDDRMMAAVADFVQSGGVMKRIFFLDHPAVPGDDAYKIMSGQQKAGVDVYYVMKDDVPRERQRKFLVDADAFFAWYVQIDEVGKIEKSIGTSDQVRCRDYVASWHYLREHYASKFVPAATR